MSNNSTRLKPKGKARYQLPMREGKHHAKEYYLPQELEATFRRLYPVTLDAQMEKMFGVGKKVIVKLKKQLCLEKDMRAIRKKQSAHARRTCEKNGYYASMRWKRPSEKAIEATRKKRAEGFCPMLYLKETDPKRFAKMIKQRGETRKAVYERERKRVSWGLSQQTKLHVPQFNYTDSQRNHRYCALKYGYITGDTGDFSGERYTIFYDESTQRSVRFERNCQKDGFHFVKL